VTPPYNNTILNAITNSNLGAHMGSIQVASPKCADDIALLGEWTDIQAMLNVIVNSPFHVLFWLYQGVLNY
jgi:hypothetical protein